MRIPFDIKYRDKIESDEYKVIYVENSSTNQYPVEILKWDSNSDAGCIIGCVRRKGKDRIYAFQENGVHTVSGEDDRLFLITPEPEMTEFEKAVSKYRPQSDSVETIQCISSELLSLAQNEFNKQIENDYREIIHGAYKRGKADAEQEIERRIQSGELLTQEHHEKLMETLLEECKKDLPRWEFYRRGTEIDPFAVVRFKDGTIGRAKYAVDDCYVLEVKDMLKLPGFKEDESHE